MRRTLVGTNGDGSPHYVYEAEESDVGADGEVHIVATGPGVGLVQLADGTQYDVTDHYIAVASEAHRTEVAHHIAVQVERTGVLDSTDPLTGERIKFRHTDCDHCDAPKTADEQSLSPEAQAQAERLRTLVAREGER